MDGQPATYITIKMDGRVMYRTDDVFGGTDEEAEQRGREVRDMLRQRNPLARVQMIVSGQPQ